MKIDEIVTVLESFAPTALQESFDNCGLLVGNRLREATGVLLCVDVAERRGYWLRVQYDCSPSSAYIQRN